MYFSDYIRKYNPNGIIIILITLTIFSCNLTGVIDLYDWQIPVKINTVQRALDYIHANYTYTPKYGVFLPDEFYKYGYGDCEDYALMLQFIFETELNKRADIVIGYYLNNLHAWVESDGKIYEPTAGIINNYPQLYIENHRYKYPDSIYMVRSYGGFI